MPYIPPSNDTEYVVEDSVVDASDSVEIEADNVATYVNLFEYTGPDDIGVPDPDSSTEVPDDSESHDPYYDVTYVARQSINDYEPAYLNELYQQGAKFYALYDDDTEVEVQWYEIENPEPLAEDVDLSEAIASASNQHFWDDTNGVHVAEVAKEDWQAALEANFADLSSSKNYYNILMNSLGLLLRRANFNLTSINRAAISFYDGLGNDTVNIMASFGRNSAQIGRSTDKHVVINDSGLTAYNADGSLAPLTGTFDGANINNSSITNAKIVDGTITGTKIASATIENSNIKDGTIEGAKIKGGTITGSLIADGTIEDTDIKNGTITGTKIASATIDNSNIKNGTITGTKIASATIENSNIKDGTITGTKIQGSTLTDIPYAGITDADIEVARVANAEIDKAKVDYAHITNGVIDNANIDKANVNGLAATYATITNLNAATARIGTIESDYLKAADMTAEQARVNNLLAGKADITDLSAATARIDDLEADHVSVEDFEAEQANIDNLQAATADIETIRANSAKVANLTAAELEADHATVGNLSATYATIDSLDAAEGRIETLEANDVTINGRLTAAEGNITNLNASKANVADLTAATGRITNLESTKADISVLESDYITADTIEATYTKTDFSNTDVAWIQNGVIKDGSISSAMINSVSANKLTAGTINGSVINVTNLNADNITAGTINGQRIGEGSLSLSKLEDDVYTEAEVDAKLSTMQSQIDGAIETWTGTAVPTLQNSPASSWNTTALKDSHVGDVYFVVNSNSQQNGYNYRFTKSGSTYSWQLIKDSDVTNALQRLTTAEGKIGTIEQFDSDISSWKTDTDEELASIKNAATTLAGRVTTAEGQIATKVETSTFNTLSQTVNENSASITQLTNETTTINNKVESQNPFIIGTQTAQTGNWTGEASTLSSLVDGQQITYWLPVAPSGNASLNLTLKDGTTTGAIPCYYSGTSRLTTHYAANNAIHLTYRTNVSGISQGWWADANYDSNTAYTKYSDTVIAGKNGLKRYTLCMRDDAGNFTSIVNQANNVNASGKTCYTGGLQLGSICCHSTGGDYAAGANSGAIWESYGGVDFRYSVNGITNASTTELQLRKPIYLVGTIGADGLFYLDTTKWWTQTSFVENKAYVFVGTAYSSYYAIFVAVENPTYIYEDGELVEIQTLQISKTTNKINTVSDTVDEHTRKIGLLETSVESKADGSTVSTISNKLNTVSDTVDGHTQSISSITSTQTTMQGKLDKTLVETTQLWFSKANTTAPNKPTAQVTSTSTEGNAWRVVVPAYNSSYPNYYYCYQWKYSDGTYGWSSVTRDIAMGESQERARTAITNAANAQSDIDNLEIGGRNLVRNGDFISGLDHWNTNGSDTTMSVVEEDSYRCLHVTGGSITGKDDNSCIHVEWSTHYMWHCWIKFADVQTISGSSPLHYWFHRGTTRDEIGATNGGWKSVSEVAYDSNGNEYSTGSLPVNTWLHVIVTVVTADKTDNYEYLNFRPFIYGGYASTSSAEYWVRRFKLEKGTKATDWTPAPEDVDADISAAQSTADTANTNASAAVSTANTANSNASIALSTANTAASDASEAKTNAVTAVSTANTANTNASAAVSTANTASTNASTAVSTANTAKSTADNAQATANKNVKSTTQLWYTKANETAPAKPTAKVTSTAVSGNGWRVVVPTYASDYPYYFYCYQYELADGTFTWSDVVYDRATTENQSNSRNAVTGVATLTTKTNDIQDTVDGHTQSLQSITQTQTTIQQNAVKSTVQLWFTKANTTAPTKPTAHVTTNNAATGNAWNLAVPTYNSAYPNYYYCYEYQYVDGSYGWSAVTRDITMSESAHAIEYAYSNNGVGAGFAKLCNIKCNHIYANMPLSFDLKNRGRNVTSVNWNFTNTSTVDPDVLKATYSGDTKLYYIKVGEGSYDVYFQLAESYDSIQILNYQNPYMRQGDTYIAVTWAGEYYGTTASDTWTEFTKLIGDTSKASVDADISTAQTSADNAQATANKNVKESQQLWFTKANGSAPNKPTAKVTSTSTGGNAWTTKVPTYNASYPHYFYCMQYVAADGTVTWSDVVYDQATTEAQSVARTTSANLSTLQQDYATFKQTTQNFESTIGTTYATKTELQTTDDKIENLEIGGRNLLFLTKDFATKSGQTNGGYLSGASMDTREPIVSEKYKGFAVRHFTTSSIDTSTYYDLVYGDLLVPISGKSYVFSFYAKGTGKIRTHFYPNVSGGTYKNTGSQGQSNTAGDGNTDFTVSSDWQRFWVRFEIGGTQGTNARHALLRVYGGNDIYVCGLKFEEGSKATDWSPAPEDVDAAIDKVDSKTSVRLHLRRDSWTDTQWGAYASVGHADNFANVHYASGGSSSATGFDATTLNVGDLIVIEGISTGTSIPYSVTAKVTSVPTSATANIPATVISANNAKAIEARVSSAETSITQNTEQIALRAKSSDVYTKTQVDGKITQEVSDRNSAIEQSASAINLSVSQTYTTKTEFNALEIGGRGTWYADWPRPITAVELGYLSEKKYIEEAGFIQDFSKKFCMRVDFMRSSSYQTQRHCLASSYGIISADTSHSYPELGIELAANTGRLRIYSTSDSGGAFDRTVGTAPELDIWSTAVVWWDPETKEITWLLVSGDRSETGHYTPSGTYSRKSGLVRLGADNRVDSTWNTKYYQRDMPPIWYDEPPEDPKNLCRWSLVETAEGNPKSASPVECSSGNASIEAAKTEIKATTDGIISTVSKISSAKYLESSTSGSSLDNIRRYASTSTQFTVVSNADVRIGDTVYLKYKDTTRNCYVYIKGTVNVVSGSTSVTLACHGYEDILPVDTIKSTINQSSDSVKIQANHVEIDGAAIFSNSAFKAAADAAYDAKGSAATAKSEAISAAATDATNKANAAQSAAISAAASDATSKANAAETNAKGYAAEQASETYEKIRSQGIQLVTNGNGFMGDNTNFSWWTFDGSKSNGSPGSFTHVPSAATIATDEMFPVDTAKDYMVEFDTFSTGSGVHPQLYAMLLFYDVDKKLMNIQQVSYIIGSTTTLARELKNGDTVIYLTDASGFIDTSVAHQRSLIFWDYTNSFGYTYPPETYSRNFYAPSAGLWSDYSKINKSNNTITLTTAWTGGTKPAGTYLSQNSSGSTYAYFWYRVGTSFPLDEWTHASSVYSGFQTGIANAMGKFYKGCSYCKIGWLWNYQNSSSDPQKQIWITNVSVKEAVATKAELDSVATTANNAAPKSSAVAEEQYIYRSAASGTTSMSGTTTWVTAPNSATASTQNAWTTKRPEYSSSYPVLFVAKQRKTVSGTVTCTTPVKDDTTTIIDGGHITTGTIDTNRLNADTIKSNIVQTTELNADKITSGTIAAARIAAGSIAVGKIDATSGTFNTANIPNLSADKITSGSISADRIKGNVISAVNNGTGTINADKINVSGLTIGYSQIDDTPTIPTKVSDLTNDSGFQNATQVNSAITSKGYQTSSQVETAITSKGYATTGQAQGYANTAEQNAKAAIPTDISDLNNDSGFITSADVPTKVSDLTNDSGFQTSNQVETAITSKGYATTEQAQGYANAKDSAIAAAAKRTDVSIAVTAINYDLGTATLQATLYIDGTVTTSGVTYKWLKDGAVISGQTARTLSVTAAMGLSHVYSCTVTYS